MTMYGILRAWATAATALLSISTTSAPARAADVLADAEVSTLELEATGPTWSEKPRALAHATSGSVSAGNPTSGDPSPSSGSTRSATTRSPGASDGASAPAQPHMR